MLGGRGAGKSHAGSIWLHDVLANRYDAVQARIIAPTQGDAINSAVFGIQQRYPEQVEWKPTAPGGARLMWANGSVAHVIGTPGPREVDRLRAVTNITYDWLEEAAANPQLPAVVDQQIFSLRAPGARWIATTTPRPLKIIQDWMDDPKVAHTHGTAFDNPANPPDFLERLEASYPKGSRIYRQEVMGELLMAFEGALWNREILEETRWEDHPPLVRMAVGVDPAVGPGTTGIIACGVTKDRELAVVNDSSHAGSPEEWASLVADLTNFYEAPVVAEANQGGEMVKSVLNAAGVTTPVHLVRASDSKRTRAEPVSLLWEAKRAHIVGSLPLLEDELVSWVPGPDSPSPDRLDAMVWAASWLQAKMYPAATLWRPKRRVPVG